MKWQYHHFCHMLLVTWTIHEYCNISILGGHLGGWLPKCLHWIYKLRPRYLFRILPAQLDKSLVQWGMWALLKTLLKHRVLFCILNHQHRKTSLFSESILSSFSANSFNCLLMKCGCEMYFQYFPYIAGYFIIPSHSFFIKFLQKVSYIISSVVLNLFLSPWSCLIN